MEINCLRIARAPAVGLDKAAFLECMMETDFIVLYDLNNCTSNIVIPEGHISKAETALSAMPIELARSSMNIRAKCRCKVVVPYRSKSTVPESLFSDIFEAGIGSGFIGVVFAHAGLKELESSKQFIEALLSRREIKETTNAQGLFGQRGKSYHRDIFNGSEEGIALSEILESMNRAALSNNLVFKPYVIASEWNTRVSSYLSKKFIIMKEGEMDLNPSAIGKSLEGISQLPYGTDMLSMYLSIESGGMASHPIRLKRPYSSGDVRLGTFLADGVSRTGTMVAVHRSALNLGAIISGVPGSGKTSEALAILDQLVAEGERPKVLVIAPTSEWNEFAVSRGLYTVRLCSDLLPINFFRCQSHNVRKFYEDLSMLIASASNNGPFQNPTEKCLLNAFRHVYSKCTEPDPIEVYEEIEEAIIRFHAKRTAAGIKYTKHGENIRSGLESIRSMLSMPEYCSKSGIDIEQMMGDGVVFDTSSVSNRMKPYMYALILNQVYALASDFDTFADNKLRLLLCIEEAQTIFGDRYSPAVVDIRRRIQDFRKQGVGLLLMAHNANDIEQDVRRLCQIKLYLKQSADIASHAAKDLSFTDIKDEEIVQKLKHLDSRVGALSYVVKEGTERFAPDTTFIRTLDYDKDRVGVSKVKRPPGNVNSPKIIKCKIVVTKMDHRQPEKSMPAGVRLYYLSEEITDQAEVRIEDGRIEVTCNLICSKHHKLAIIDQKGRVIRALGFIAAEMVRLEV